jgi:hypothetical protein
MDQAGLPALRSRKTKMGRTPCRPAPALKGHEQVNNTWRQKNMQRNLSDAHLPTWLKMRLCEARMEEREKYLEAGWHTGFHLDRFEVRL